MVREKVNSTGQREAQNIIFGHEDSGIVKGQIGEKRLATDQVLETPHAAERARSGYKVDWCGAHNFQWNVRFCMDEVLRKTRMHAETQSQSCMHIIIKTDHIAENQCETWIV